MEAQCDLPETFGSTLVFLLENRGTCARSQLDPPVGPEKGLGKMRKPMKVMKAHLKKPATSGLACLKNKNAEGMSLEDKMEQEACWAP